MQIIETGTNPARTKDYQLRQTESGTFELWLYRRGKLYAKKYFKAWNRAIISFTVDRFYAGQLKFHPLNMRGLGDATR